MSLNYNISLLYPSILAVFSITSIFLTKLPNFEIEKSKIKKESLVFIICFFILLSILIRSFIGFMVVFPWKIGFLLGFIFTI
ncbi:MAG: hypothetical protein LBC61_03935 [Candidatus Peribacteria bacterium]|nr:hypothetical protein [Candidatus Peribacteria bacterium]